MREEKLMSRMRLSPVPSQSLVKSTCLVTMMTQILMKAKEDGFLGPQNTGEKLLKLSQVRSILKA